jgi:prepilin-type N-terminal cleavage/methylation domain-containing protein
MRRTTQKGVTLVELMVAIGIIGILAGLAVAKLRKSSYNAGGYAYAQKLDAEINDMRMRSVATRRYQRLTVGADTVLHEESTTQGMAAPTAWQTVRQVDAPSGVQIGALDSTAHVTEGNAVPSVGTGIGGTLTFAADGSAETKTIFVWETSGQAKARIVVYLTGASYVYQQW